MLVRDPSIQTDAVTWQLDGSGGGIVDMAMIRHLVGGGVERFIADYFSVNPKQSATSGNAQKTQTKTQPSP